MQAYWEDVKNVFLEGVKIMGTLLKTGAFCLMLASSLWFIPQNTWGQKTGGGMSGKGESINSHLKSIGPLVAADSDMHFFTSYTLPGGYVASGVAMRNLGAGKIIIKGIPRGATIEAAFLYWGIINPTATDAMAAGSFNGNAIKGINYSIGGDPCWYTGSMFAYRADVTEFVTGNGTYNLSGFASGITTGSSPWDGVAAPLCEGATLVIVYRRETSFVQTIVLYEGCPLFFGDLRYGFTMGGFVADPVKKATLTIFGADGQDGVGGGPIKDIDKEFLEFNGTIIAQPNSPWNGADGQPLPQLWDTHTYNVKSLVAKGSKQVTVANTGYETQDYYDCMNWIGAIFAVTAKDTDRDGLVDDWETNGYDQDGDGAVDVDLPGMGANPKRKDVFVEIDYMVGDDHTHKPIGTATSMIVKSFKNAPVVNPDGSKGITLHIDDGSFGGGNALTHNDDLSLWENFDSIKEANFLSARKSIFHYCIFAHNLAGMGSTSGISRGIPGNGLVVSLGGWTNKTGTTQEQAGTFMHELGHNIGLRHGGSDHSNYKPNYLSVMNYFFQTRGLSKNGVEGNFDYSRYKNITLDESNLKERLGIGNPKKYGTRFSDPSCTIRAVVASKPIDWDWDGATNAGSVSVDINHKPPGDACDGVLSGLVGFIDWADLILNGRALGESSPNAFRGILSEQRNLSTKHVNPPMNELTVEADSNIPPFPPSRTSRRTIAPFVNQITWRPAGLEIVVHYNVYSISKTGAYSLIGKVLADPKQELTLLGEYTYTLPGENEGVYGVSTVDHYGNESSISLLR